MKSDLSVKKSLTINFKQSSDYSMKKKDSYLPHTAKKRDTFSVKRGYYQKPYSTSQFEEMGLHHVHGFACKESHQSNQNYSR